MAEALAAVASTAVVAAASTVAVAVAASMAAVVVDLAVEGTVTKDERLGYELF
jgi:hypothetical protein